jgi:hypothetical protein
MQHIAPGASGFVITKFLPVITNVGFSAAIGGFPLNRRRSMA